MEEDKAARADQMFEAVIAAILAAGGARPDANPSLLVERYRQVLTCLRTTGGAEKGTPS